MFKKIYGTCRSRRYNNSLELNNISLNGIYDTTFFNGGQFKDYEEAGITKLTMPISNDRFTGTLPKIDENEQIIGTVHKLTRFVMLEYSDIYTNATDLGNSISSSSSDTVVDLFDTPAEAITWVKANTDLIEVDVGKFELEPAGVDIEGNPVDAKYLIID